MGIRRALYILTLLAAATSAAAEPSPPAGALFWPSRIDRPIDGNAQMADVNQDGRTDLVFVDYYKPWLCVAFGHPDSLFCEPVTVLTSPHLRSDFTLVDVDGDDILDLLSRGHLFSGRGGGKFGEARQIVLPGDVGRWIFADMDGDQNLDIVYTVRNRTEAVVLANDGSLAFAETHRYPIDESGAKVTVADVDNNGSLDIVTWKTVSRLNIVRRDTKGDLIDRTFVDTESNVRAIDLADLNGDGTPDLVAVYWTRAVLYEGQGDGTFQVVRTTEAASGLMFGGGMYEGVKLRDVDGDGDTDILLPSSNGMKNDLSLVANQGGWQFDEPALFNTANYYAPQSVDVGDPNGDGTLDVIVSASGYAQVYPGNPVGPQPIRGAAEIPSEGKAYRLASADVNHDGTNDLLAMNWEFGDESRLMVYSGRDLSVIAQTPVDHPRIYGFVLANLNGDEHIDGIGWGWSQYPNTVFEFVFLIGEGDGGFALKTQTERLESVDVLVGDVTGDGLDDYVTVEPNRARLHVNSGYGAFENGGDVPVGSILADLNNDRFADLVVRVNNRTTFYYGSADGFTDGTTLDTRGRSMCVGDVNEDGRTDFVSIGRQVEVFLGRADGTLDEPRTSELSRPYWIAQYSGSTPADVTGDGKADLLVKADGEIPSLVVLVGDGAGNFYEHPYFYDAGFQGRNIVAGDFDNDGAIDVATSSSYGSPVKVLWGLVPRQSPEPVPPVGHLRIFPNPFRTSATFHYVAASPGVVRATIFDVAGRRVASLVDDTTDEGPRLLRWDGRTTGGTSAPAGVYFVEIRQGHASGRQTVVRTR